MEPDVKKNRHEFVVILLRERMRRNEFRALIPGTVLTSPSPLPFQGSGEGNGEVRVRFIGFLGRIIV
jgi:hypothetical protein